MRPLRPGSWRPLIIVDHRARRLKDPATGTYVGFEGPLSRERVVFALPINGQRPFQAKPPRVVHDHDGDYLGDPDGKLIGHAGFWITRLLPATKTEDTRRL